MCHRTVYLLYCGFKKCTKYSPLYSHFNHYCNFQYHSWLQSSLLKGNEFHLFYSGLQLSYSNTVLLILTYNLTHVGYSPVFKSNHLFTVTSQTEKGKKLPASTHNDYN